MEFIVEKNNWQEVSKFILDSVSDKNLHLINLYGDLGAGKTTLTQTISKILGIKENVTSPTFVILKKYKIKNQDFVFKNLVHIDAYRLEKKDDLSILGWDNFLKDKNTLIILEWPENVDFSGDSCCVYIEHINDSSRKVKIVL